LKIDDKRREEGQIRVKEWERNKQSKL